MPLFHDFLKVGLGLWQFPWVSYLLEVCVFLLAGVFLIQRYQKKRRHVILIVMLIVGFSAMFFAPQREVSADLASITSLCFYAVFALLAYWCEPETRR